ncbi:hypothetical protein H8B15_17695 [Hymenobacter sp. BT507]|uniref:Nucleotide-diphospho-sugar transferase domain-containing protein n=1 Tax=Hymenobacter citatus TaxID=2763506 RepID=A0ABR7MNV0_9BACT|nr:hypothetical protein [Hymenobacter citatus]MBC6612761.1 hypothetical protein [Hymenobacter citatus]
MHLLYLVFGTNIKNHFQANFSILSFLQQSKALNGITVVTDAPDFYRHLQGHVAVLPIDETRLREWKGEFDFFWRIKIKALEYVAQQRPGSALLYLDSDTFLYGSLPQMQAALADGQAFMHEAEGKLATLPSKTEQRMWQQVRQQTFGGIQMHEQHTMWNAGVVGIPAAQATETIALALRICDDMSRQQVTPRLIEQFALSVALAEMGPLQAASPYIGHYWSTKEEWNEAITAFLLESHLYQRSIADEVAAMATFEYRTIPIKKRVKSTQGRLEKLVRRLFPPQNITYIKPTE